MGKMEFDILNINNKVGNTGIPEISYDPANTEGLLLTPIDAVITPTDALTIESFIQAKLAHDDPNERWYLIKRFEGIEVKDTEASYSETPFGVRRKNRDGKYGCRWEYKDGGLDYHTVLKTFDGKQGRYRAFEIDNVNNCLLGCKSGENRKGFRLDMIEVPNFSRNTGADSAKYYIELAYADPKEMNVNHSVLQFRDDFSLLEDFNSLFQTQMFVAVAMDATGLVSLGFKVGKENLYDEYKAILSDATLHEFTVRDTGAVIDISSIVADDASKTIIIQLDALDPDFPASGTVIRDVFGPVSDIETAGMPGFSEAEIATPLG